MKKRGLKGQSQIIGAILLILLVIISAMIIMGFAIPFVRDNLSGTECLDAVGKIEIRNNPAYTCYDSVGTNMRVQIHVGDIEDVIKGFQIAIESGGDSNSYKIVNGTSSTEVSMYSGGNVEAPGKNQERTYTISGINSLPDRISVYPILNDDKTCDVSDFSDNLASCS
jgi:flagellin-like protein